jgi:hypothetical protein
MSVFLGYCSFPIRAISRARLLGLRLEALTVHNPALLYQLDVERVHAAAMLEQTACLADFLMTLASRWQKTVECRFATCLDRFRRVLSKDDLIPLGDLLSCTAICLPESLC